MRIKAFWLLFPVLTLASAPAHAYIDPNAGGWLFQLLTPVLTAVLGGWLVLRRWIAAKVRSLLERFRR